MGSFGWVLIQRDSCPYKEGKSGLGHAPKEDQVKTEGGMAVPLEPCSFKPRDSKGFRPPLKLEATGKDPLASGPQVEFMPAHTLASRL